MSEISFKRDTAFRKQFFVPDSFAHPAKMDAQLLIWIVERYTKPGEVILDPMAGMGTTMLACTLGRNVVLVELEGKFCKMMTGYECDGQPKGETEQFQDGEWRKVIIPAECGEKKIHNPHHVMGNWEIVKMHPQLGYSMGTCQIIQGDARNLEGLLADKIITSPPYAETGASGKSRSPFWERLADDPTSARYGREKHPSVGEGYSADPNNIGNLPYGQIDEIITSPPFGEAQTGGGIAQKGYQVSKHSPTDLVGKRSYMPNIHGEAEGQIGNLKYGEIDKIISSPPFGEAHNSKDLGVGDNDRADLRDYSYLKSGTEGQISDLPYGQIDKIVTSPPYEGICETTHASLEAEEGKPYQDKRSGRKGTKWEFTGQKKERYSEDKNNIGNLKGGTYLEAMNQVYQQCHRILKPGGLMILVLKNFIRNKAVVRLDLDTIKLCEQAGFKLTERHYRKLSSQSFWRIIYYQKHPEVELIDKEDILVFRR